MSQRAENECSFAVDVRVISFTFNEHCSAKSLACIASVVQQLLQMPLVVLIDIYFEVFMSTLVALVMTTLYTLYNAACFEIQLKWCFFNYRYFIQEGLTFLVF